MLICDICKRYDIPCTRENIIGHDEYDHNKHDPGELFDWELVMSRAHQLLGE